MTDDDLLAMFQLTAAPGLAALAGMIEMVNQLHRAGTLSDAGMRAIAARIHEQCRDAEATARRPMPPMATLRTFLNRWAPD